jgi:hypothetical protein
MAQWEICRAALVIWQGNMGEYEIKVVLHYFTTTGIIAKSGDNWGQVLAILGAAEWEPINIQHGLDIADVPSVRGTSGRVRGMYMNHPSGEARWEYMDCSMVAYFKRPIQAGRAIDDAL